MGCGGRPTSFPRDVGFLENEPAFHNRHAPGGTAGGGCEQARGTRGVAGDVRAGEGGPGPRRNGLSLAFQESVQRFPRAASLIVCSCLRRPPRSRRAWDRVPCPVAWSAVLPWKPMCSRVPDRGYGHREVASGKSRLIHHVMEPKAPFCTRI